jgi:ATP-dependent RNA helicase DDX52/ROK1
MLIFVQSKHRAKELYNELLYDSVKIGVMHADMVEKERDATVERFRCGELWVLICSDLMARGIDFKGVNTVINYDFPQSIVNYIHRIGRAGRAGNRGTAITFVTRDDVELLKPIVNLLKKSGCEVAEWMLKLKAPDKKRRKELEIHPVKRKKISTNISAHIDKQFQRQIAKRQKQIDKNKRKQQENEDEFEVAGEEDFE